MQNQSSPASSPNVISLFEGRRASKESPNEGGADKEGFDSAINRNAENAERMRKERLKANQSVLKSYRIKN